MKGLVELESELKLFYEGVSDHEIAHLLYTEFTNPNAKKIMIDTKAISLIKNPRVNQFLQIYFEENLLKMLFHKINI